MSVDQALAQVAKAGLFIHNLFQVANGHWQANLRTSQGAFEWAVAENPAEALLRALELSIGSPEPFSPQEIHLANEPRVKKPSTSYEDLFS